MPSVISMLGDMIPILAGAVLAERMNGPAAPSALTWIGDGGTSTGAFHEGLNFACVQKAPLVLIVENNKWAYSTPTTKQTANTRFVDRARAYGCHGGAGRRQRRARGLRGRRGTAIERARRGEGPDPDRGRHHAHARPRRARRHEVRARRSCSRSGRRRTRIAALRAAPARRRPRPSAELDAVVAEIDARSSPRTWPSPRRAPCPTPAQRPRPASTPTAPVASPIPPLVARVGEARRPRLMAVLTYLEAIRLAMFEEMQRDPRVFVIGEDVGDLRRRLPGHPGLPRDVRPGARHRHADQRDRDRGRRHRRRAHGHAADRRDAVHRLHLLRLRHARELRGQEPLPLGRRRAHRGARPLRGRRARRALPQPEPRGVLHERAGPQDRGPGDARPTPRA